jgi:hypothetical protein
VERSRSGEVSSQERRRNEIRCRHVLLELNDETSGKYSRSEKKKENGMNSLHKRISLFKSPKLRRKLPIHNNDIAHSSSNISHRGAAFDP